MRFYISIFKAIGGAFALMLIVMFSCTSCNSGAPNWVEECENGGMYKEHSFRFVSIYTDSNGYYTDECRNCGLQRKFMSDKKCKDHFGAVHVYKSPNSGKFDVYILEYADEEGTHFKRIYMNSIVNDKNK